MTKIVKESATPKRLPGQMITDSKKRNLENKKSKTGKSERKRKRRRNGRRKTRKKPQPQDPREENPSSLLNPSRLPKTRTKIRLRLGMEAVREEPVGTVPKPDPDKLRVRTPHGRQVRAEAEKARATTDNGGNRYAQPEKNYAIDISKARPIAQKPIQVYARSGTRRLMAH